MLIIQTPGSIILTYFQAVMYRESWSTWVPYLITTIQMSMLLTLCLYYTIRDCRKPKVPDLESKPLLIVSSAYSVNSTPFQLSSAKRHQTKKLSPSRGFYFLPSQRKSSRLKVSITDSMPSKFGNHIADRI